MIAQHRDGDVAVIEIDRHERRNALDTAHCQDLRAALTGTARAIVITGAGSSFCAGADLGGVYDTAFRDALYAMLAAVTQVPVPVLALELATELEEEVELELEVDDPSPQIADCGTQSDTC